MADSIVRVAIVADAKGLKAGMGDAEKATVSLGQKFKLLGQAAAAFLAFQAVRAVKNFVTDSRRAFIDLAESVNAVDRIFGDLAPQIHAIGKVSADSMGISRAAFNEAAVAMSGFARNIAGDGGDVVGVLETLMRRAVDFASVVNIEVNEALEIFQSTLAGQSRPIRRYGIDISDTAVKEHALAVGLISANEQMGEQQKQAARASLLLQETNRFAGDFADTQDELANATRRATARLEDAKANFGAALENVWRAGIPVMNALAQGINLMADAFQGLTGAITPAERAFRDFDTHMGEVEDQGARALTVLHDMSRTLGEVGKGFEESAKNADEGKQSFGAWSDAINDWSRSLDLGATDLARLSGASNDYLVNVVGIAEDALPLFKQAVDDKMRKAVRDAMKPVQDLGEGVEDLGDEAEDAADDVAGLGEAVETTGEKIRRQTDPVFNYIKANEDLASAAAEVIRLEEEGAKGTPEWIAAMQKRGLAILDIGAAAQTLADSGITRDTWIQMAANMGIARAEALLVWKELQRIKDIGPINQQVNIVTRRTTGGGVQAFQHGGRPKRGEPAIVGEDGPEIFVPDTAGTIIPNGKTNGSAVGGPTIQVVFPGNVYGFDDLEQRVLELIERARRRGIAV